ncbi:MAG: S-layer homology domain-containing protein [bacterium]
MSKSGPLLWTLLILTSVGGCIYAPYTLAPEVAPPEEYLKRGLGYIDDGRLFDAEREFKTATSEYKDYGPAYGGLGLTYALMAAGERDPARQAKLFNLAIDSGREGKTRFRPDYRREDILKATILMGRIFYTRAQSTPSNRSDERRGWADAAIGEFRFAADHLNDSSEAQLWMGRTYTIVYKFDEAREAFRMALDLGDERFLTEAYEEYRRLRKISRASPQTEFAKEIAISNKITRAQLAALFVWELEIERRLLQPTPRPGDIHRGVDAFSEMAPRIIPQQEVKLKDVPENHWAREYVTKAVSLGVMSASTRDEFRPEDYVTRAECAEIVENLLAKIEGNPHLLVRYHGSSSPFADVPPEHRAFNAIVVSVNSGVMEYENREAGTFNPEGLLSGEDALLVIRQLKDIL